MIVVSYILLICFNVTTLESTLRQQAAECQREFILLSEFSSEGAGSISKVFLVQLKEESRRVQGFLPGE